MWAALSEAGLPLSLHTTATKGLSFVRAADPTPAKGIFQSLPPMFMAEILGTFIAGGVLKKFPGLHIVLVEAGIGWIPYYLERLDTMHRRHNWAKRGMMEELPSTFWYSQCHATFEDDMVGMEILDRIGVNNVMWASDYPHPDSTWPESQEDGRQALPAPARRGQAEDLLEERRRAVQADLTSTIRKREGQASRLPLPLFVSSDDAVRSRPTRESLPAPDVS